MATLKKSRPRVSPRLGRKSSDKHSLDLNRAPDDTYGLGIYDADRPGCARSVHDVQFTSQHSGRRALHNRSISGTSTTTTSSYTGHGQRFVHPKAQYATPAASYQGSLIDSEYSRDSPALTEDEDSLRYNFRSSSNLATRDPTPSGSTSPHPHLRIQTKISSSKLSKLSHNTSGSPRTSTSQLHSSSAPLQSPSLNSPSGAMTPISTIRSSIDKGLRLRSRSEAVSVTSSPLTHAEEIREARRRFEERERAKDEKIAQEQYKAQEKRERKEQQRKMSDGRRSTASESSRPRRELMNEKTTECVGRGSYSGTYATPPTISEETTTRSRTRSGLHATKTKTQSAWMRLVLWFRTRLLRMSQRHEQQKQR